MFVCMLLCRLTVSSRHFVLRSFLEFKRFVKEIRLRYCIQTLLFWSILTFTLYLESTKLFYSIYPRVFAVQWCVKCSYRKRRLYSLIWCQGRASTSSTNNHRFIQLQLLDELEWFTYILVLWLTLISK